MTRKFDVGCCECSTETTCCDSLTSTCSSSGEPEDRCCCFCSAAPPCEYDVTISGVYDISGDVNPWQTCENCSNYNNTYTLQRYASSDSMTDASDSAMPSSDYCLWWGFFNCMLPSDAAKCKQRDPFGAPTQWRFGGVNVMTLQLFNEGGVSKFLLSYWDVSSAYFQVRANNWCDWFCAGATETTNLCAGLLNAGLGIVPADAMWQYVPTQTSGIVDCNLSSASFTRRASDDGIDRLTFCDWSGHTVEVSAG